MLDSRYLLIENIYFLFLKLNFDALSLPELLQQLEGILFPILGEERVTSNLLLKTT